MSVLQTNGKLNGHTERAGTRPGVEQENLEDSLSSLLSSSSSIIQQQSDSLDISNIYNKAARLFVNRKFRESFKITSSIIDLVAEPFSEDDLDEDLLINCWSLYLNLIDVYINKSDLMVNYDQNLRNSDFDQLVSRFHSNYLFDKIADSNRLISPKLVSLLIVVYLNDKNTDLTKLRAKVEVYLVTFTSYIQQGIVEESITDKSFASYQEVLKTYHLSLLPKLGNFEENEYLIKNNTYIADPSNLIEKLHNVEHDLKEQKMKLDKEKELQLARRAKENQESIRRQQKKIKEQEESQQTQSKNEKKDIVSTSTTESSILEIIKDHFLSKYSDKQAQLMGVISIISLLLLVLKNNNVRALFQNNKIRQIFRSFWTRLMSTLQMAFKVTYI